MIGVFIFKNAIFATYILLDFVFQAHACPSCGQKVTYFGFRDIFYRHPKLSLTLSHSLQFYRMVYSIYSSIVIRPNILRPKTKGGPYVTMEKFQVIGIIVGKSMHTIHKFDRSSDALSCVLVYVNRYLNTEIFREKN